MRIVEGGRKNLFLCRMLARPSSQVMVAQEKDVGQWAVKVVACWAYSLQRAVILGFHGPIRALVSIRGTSSSSTEIKLYVPKQREFYKFTLEKQVSTVLIMAIAHQHMALMEGAGYGGEASAAG